MIFTHDPSASPNDNFFHTPRDFKCPITAARNMTTRNIRGFNVPFQPTRRNFANIWTEYEPNKRVLLPNGWRRENRLPLRCAIVWDKDVPVAMRDGTILRVDIFRPASKETERLPALVPWSPYGKTGSGLLMTKEYPYIGVPGSQTSGLEKFEAPDPADWCARGYAVVQADARGTFNSEGDMYQFGTQVRWLFNLLSISANAYNIEGSPRRIRPYRVDCSSIMEQRKCCHHGKLMAWHHAMVGEWPPSCQCNDVLTFSKVHCCREATSSEGYRPLGRCWRLLSPNFVSRWNPESCFLGQAFDHHARYVLVAMMDSHVRA